MGNTPRRESIIRGQFQVISSAGASEESTRKVPKARTYRIGISLCDVDALDVSDATGDVHHSSRVLAVQDGLPLVLGPHRHITVNDEGGQVCVRAVVKLEHRLRGIRQSVG